MLLSARSVSPQIVTIVSLPSSEMVVQIQAFCLPDPTWQHTSSRSEQLRRLQAYAHWQPISCDRPANVIHFPWSHILHARFYDWFIALG